MLDRESNEVKYLREATELIEESQFRLQGGQRVSAPASDHGEVILIEWSVKCEAERVPCPFDELVGGHFLCFGM